MIVKNKENNPIERIDPLGGHGILKGFPILSAEDLDHKLTGLFINELEVGGEIGFHQHKNNSEVYYITKGQAMVKDNNDIWITLNVGDTLYTKDQEFHAIKNSGDVPMEFIAFIINQ